MFKRAAFLFALTGAAPAAADLSQVAQLEVIPGWTTSNGTHIAGLNIALAPGWKTYWRAPGDGGIPPVMVLEGSSNVDAARFIWPVPDVFEQNGMRSIGYIGGVVLPVELTPKAPDDMHMSGSIQIGVCLDICVPVTLDFDAAIPRSETKDPALLAAILDRPLSAEEAGVNSATCSVAPISDGLQVTAAVDLPHTGGDETMVIEAGDETIWVSEAYVSRSGSTLTGTVDMVAGSGAPFALNRSAIRITVLGQTQAVDIRGCSAR